MSIQLIKSEDIFKHTVRYILEIDRSDYADFFPTEFDDLLIQECNASEKISDKLLALETIVRRIEEHHNKKKEQKL